MRKVKFQKQITDKTISDRDASIMHLTDMGTSENKKKRAKQTNADIIEQ